MRNYEIRMTDQSRVNNYQSNRSRSGQQPDNSLQTDFDKNFKQIDSKL